MVSAVVTFSEKAVDVVDQGCAVLYIPMSKQDRSGARKMRACSLDLDVPEEANGTPPSMEAVDEASL